MTPSPPQKKRKKNKDKENPKLIKLKINLIVNFNTQFREML